MDCLWEFQHSIINFEPTDWVMVVFIVVVCCRLQNVLQIKIKIKKKNIWKAIEVAHKFSKGWRSWFDGWLVGWIDGWLDTPVEHTLRCTNNFVFSFMIVSEVLIRLLICYCYFSGCSIIMNSISHHCHNMIFYALGNSKPMAAYCVYVCCQE